jgi:hypothetical protein
LYSTVDGLYRFDRALNTDVVSKRTTRQEYFVEGGDNGYERYTEAPWTPPHGGKRPIVQVSPPHSIVCPLNVVGK